MAVTGCTTREDKVVLAGSWLFLRILTILWGASLSSFKPITASEQSMSVWPPAAPWGAWLERISLAPWARWDVFYYLKIASQGYRATDGTAQFHPLFPWLAAPLARLTGQPLLSLIVLSSLAGFILLFAFECLACLDWEKGPARTSTLFFLFSPFAFVLFIPYTEGLFLCWATFCLLSARRCRWWLAGFAGMLATLTRQQGIFLLIPLGWEMWEIHKPDLRSFLKSWRMWGALGLVPAGWLVWSVYRAVVLQDLCVDLTTGNSFIYSLLISPSAAQVVPVQIFLWPWKVLGIALQQVWLKPGIDLVTNFVLVVWYMGLVVLSWPHLRTSYRLYVASIVLISFSYYTGPIHPYMGLPRHLLLAFPAFLGLGAAAIKPWQRSLLQITGILGMLFLLLLFIFKTWVP